MNFEDIPQITAIGSYSVNVNFAYLEKQLSEWSQDYVGGLELNPDFQRGHVWTEEQQVKFVEYALKGGLSYSSGMILFNCSDWNQKCEEPVQLVDGLQRLSAVLKFLRNEIKVFGFCRDEIGGNIRSNMPMFEFRVNNLPTKNAVLQWYLDLNSGGTVHSNEELMRVQSLMDVEDSNSFKL